MEDTSNSEIILFFNYFMTLRPAETAQSLECYLPMVTHSLLQALPNTRNMVMDKYV